MILSVDDTLLVDGLDADVSELLSVDNDEAELVDELSLVVGENEGRVLTT